MSGYRGLMRRKLLEEIYDKMSEEERRTFIQMSIMNADAKEIKDALIRQQMQLDRIEKSQNWYVDFGSDVAANFFTDGILWLGSRLFKKLL